MEKLDKAEIQAQSLDRARNGQSLMNYPAIYAGFAEKGIAEPDIKPRENVFTFNAWKALGRSVKKGEHGVKVTTWINVQTGEEGEENDGYRIPKLSTVFHISQTEPTADREARLAANPTSTYHGRRHRKNYQHDNEAWNRLKKSAEPVIRDPGEDAADRWTETHY